LRQNGLDDENVYRWVFNVNVEFNDEALPNSGKREHQRINPAKLSRLVMIFRVFSDLFINFPALSFHSKVKSYVTLPRFWNSFGMKNETHREENDTILSLVDPPSKFL
jgi:hypothetical protein